MRIESADFIDNCAAELSLDLVVVSKGHLQHLGNPEKPDPRWHLIKVLLDATLGLRCASDFSKFGGVKFPLFLDQIKDLRYNEPALMQAKSYRTEIAFENILEGHFIFLDLEYIQVELGIAQPRLIFFLIQ